MANDEIKGIAEKLKASKKPLIVMPKNPDPDALGASLGLFLAMKKLKKEPCIASSSKISKKYEYLEEYNSIKREIENRWEYCISFDIENEDIRAVNAEKTARSLKIRIAAGAESLKVETMKLTKLDSWTDSVIAISVPKLGSLGRIYNENKEIFQSLDLININNSKNSENFGSLVLSDVSITVSEIIFAVICEIDPALIDSKISTALLSGIIAGTKNFQAKKIGYRTFETASRLMASGADREEVIRYFKRSDIPFYVIECYGKIADKIGRSQDVSQALSRIEEFARSKKLNAAEKTVLILMVVAFASQNLKNSGNNVDVGQNQVTGASFSKRNIVYAVDKLPISDEMERLEAIPASEIDVEKDETASGSVEPIESKTVNMAQDQAINENISVVKAEISEPKTIRISDIKVNANIQYVGLNEDGSVGVPSNEKEVAWYMFGPRPGEVGNSVIIGHRDSSTNPNGVFRRLNELSVGDVIEVTDTNNNILKFKVVKKSAYQDKNSPIKEIFGSTEKKMLNLITCYGSWNDKTNNYTQRIVVYSELAE